MAIAAVDKARGSFVASRCASGGQVRVAKSVSSEASPGHDDRATPFVHRIPAYARNSGIAGSPGDGKTRDTEYSGRFQMK
jgi:hypothetical protein